MTPTNLDNRKWGISGGVWTPVGEIKQTLAPGTYEYNYLPLGLQDVSPKHDKIIRTGLANEIGTDILKFLSARDMYRKLHFLHKRGVMLIGYPGTGKSMTANLVAAMVIAQGGVSLVTRCYAHMVTCVRMIRAVHPDLPICNIMEDIEEWYEDEPEDLLAFLDGAEQTDCIVNIATTNNPERLESRLVDRPGRFDVVRWVGPPEDATRLAYLRGSLPTDTPSQLIEEMVAASEGLLLSHMREVVLGVMVQGRTVEDVTNDLKTMQKRSSENDAKRKAMSELVSKMPPDLAKQMKQQTRGMEALVKAVAAKAAA